MVTLTSYHFGCSITWWSTCSFERLPLSVHIWKTKINDLDIVLIIKQQIFWLKISVTNFNFMNIFDTRYNLLNESACLFFLQSFPFNDKIKQFATCSILHYQKQLPWCFNNLKKLKFNTYLIKLNDIWMSDYLQNMNFTSNAVHIWLIFNLILFKNFYGYFLSSYQMSTKSYFSKGSLT